LFVKLVGFLILLPCFGIAALLEKGSGAIGGLNGESEQPDEQEQCCWAKQTSHAWLPWQIASVPTRKKGKTERLGDWRILLQKQLFPRDYSTRQ
jgi:hypothetical protein